MMFHKLERLEDYVRYVQENRAELKALHDDILISVTRFFRDPEVFEALKTEVLPQLLAQRRPNQPIRVWAPGCATGEEAYSLAMCLLEYCEEEMRNERIQVFGTDIDDDAIQRARRGVYPANIALDVSSDRLRRFFVQKDDEYQIARRIREMVVFSHQDVLQNAPFSHLDLVSCRNLLIYLQPSAQKKVLRMLHFVLNPTGHLLLGTSESVSDATELFSPVDRKHKIFSKKLVASRVALDLASTAPARIEPTRASSPRRPTLTLQALADRKVLELYGPPGVVVSEDGDILQFRGHTGPFLDPAPGAASLNLLKVVRLELHIELKRALDQARVEQQRVTADITYQEDGQSGTVRVDVVPLHEPDSKTRCFLVLLHKVPRPKELVPVAAELATTGDAAPPLVQRAQEIERELAVTKEYLHATIEDRETALEELESANEELQSSNEELQSMNEELETSKEEMQSTNEELTTLNEALKTSKEELQSTNLALTTLNEELHDRMAELSQANDDLHNVLTGVDNAVVIVGMDLRIRRYTTAAAKLFDLGPDDAGRPIRYLDAFLGIGPVEPKVSAVIHSLSTLNEELLAANQRWYELRVSPYQTLDHAIRGALVTLVDVDVKRRALDVARDVGAYAAKFLGAISHPLLIVDEKLRVVWANDDLFSTLQLSAEETIGSTLASLGGRYLAVPELRERLEGVFASASILRGYEVRFPSPDGGERSASLGASLIPASTEVPLALVSIEPTEPGTSGEAS